MTNIIYTSWLACPHHMIQSTANLVVPAAVRPSIDNLDGHFLCTAVYVSQPQEALCLAHKHTHTSVCLLSWEREREWVRRGAVVLSSHKVVCACFILVTQDGPRSFCAWGSEVWGCRGRGSLLLIVSTHTQAAESSHLFCPLPAFHTASVPDWSTTPEPTTTSSLPPHTHSHTQSCMVGAKEFVTRDAFFFDTAQFPMHTNLSEKKYHYFLYFASCIATRV